MGHKNICLNCRIAFNNGYILTDRLNEIPCPKCGNLMRWMPHRFRPPKKSEKEKWAVVGFLLDHGFSYRLIFDDSPQGPVWLSVKYPQTVREAKEFIERYKENPKLDIL